MDTNVILQIKGPPYVTCTLEGNGSQWHYALKTCITLSIIKMSGKNHYKSKECLIINAKSSFYKLKDFYLFYFTIKSAIMKLFNFYLT